MNTSSKTSIKILNLVFLSLLLPSIQLLSAEPTTTTPTTTIPPAPQSDRSGSSGAAGAAAAAGAAMAGLGCIMGLKAAQEAGPAEKPMLQMMAMQQCAQAAQNAASAAENNKQKDKLDAPPAAQGPGFQPPPQIKEPEDGKPVDLSKFAQNETKSDSKSETKLPNFDPPPLADASTKPEEGAGNPIGPILPATSNPQVVDNSTITAKKDSKDDDANSAASKVLGSALGSRGAVDDLLKKALAENATAPGQTPMIRPGGASGRNSAEAAAENGGGFGGAESKADNSFDSLLAQMMGGGSQSAGMEMGMLNGGTQVISLPKDKNGKPKLNIFQFASSLYSEMAHTTNRIMIHPLKTTTPSERSLATVTNTVAKASIR